MTSDAARAPRPALLGLALLCLGALPGRAGAEVVATVEYEGRHIEIERARVEAWLEARPEATAREAVDALVDFELLVLKAQATGLARHPRVRDQVRPVLVGRYLEKHFEASLQKEDIPERYLRQAYDMRRSYFQHPDLRHAVHIIVTEGGEAPTDPARLEMMNLLCAEVQRAVVEDPPPDDKAFLKVAEAFAPRAEENGLELRGEDLRWFTNPGRYDPVFTAAAFGLELEQISEPVNTKFGCHVIRLAGIRPARDDDYEAALPELRERLLDTVRNTELIRLLAEKHEAAKVEVLGQP